MTTRSLFDPPSVAGSETSRAAAEELRPSAETLRERVHALLVERGGLTDLEIQAALGMDGNTERPRRVELQRAGLVVDSGEKRRTPSGRSAVVWRAR